MKINKAKRALQHMKSLGMWNYTKTPQKPVRVATDRTRANIELSKILLQVKKQVKR